MAAPLAASNNRLPGFLCGVRLPCLAGALGTARPVERNPREDKEANKGTKSIISTR